MKHFLAFVLMLTSFATYASPDFICTLNNLDRVVAIAEKHSEYDKNRHCAVSCMLALKCRIDEVMLVGTLKEIRDIFGSGNAEMADLKADGRGVSLAAHGAALTDKDCLFHCDHFYAP